MRPVAFRARDRQDGTPTRSSGMIEEQVARIETKALPGRNLLLAILTAAIFLSAALLFVIEPMFTKMVLPRLGGSPSVWSVAMVFFQTMLLAGYAYAHVLVRMLRPTLAVAAHLVLLVAAGLTLPLGIASGWGIPWNQWSAFWLLGLYVASIGL